MGKLHDRGEGSQASQARPSPLRPALAAGNMADAAGAAPVPAGLQVYMGSPALHKAVRAQETVSLLPLQRSVLVGKDVACATVLWWEVRHDTPPVAPGVYV